MESIIKQSNFSIVTDVNKEKIKKNSWTRHYAVGHLVQVLAWCLVTDMIMLRPVAKSLTRGRPTGHDRPPQCIFCDASHQATHKSIIYEYIITTIMYQMYIVRIIQEWIPTYVYNKVLICNLNELTVYYWEMFICKSNIV